MGLTVKESKKVSACKEVEVLGVVVDLKDKEIRPADDQLFFLNQVKSKCPSFTLTQFFEVKSEFQNPVYENSQQK